jgi:hypothetical protein
MPAGAGDFSDLAIEIIPENLVSRQAGNAHFRQRGCLACDPVIPDSPSPAGL